MRIYEELSVDQQYDAWEMVEEGLSQKKIARNLGVSKQRVATFLKQSDLGVRRGWVPTDTTIRGQASGYQLHFIADFVNVNTLIERKDVHCWSMFHRKFDRELMTRECEISGQAQCGDEWDYTTDNSEWTMENIRKEYKTHWKPR